VSGPVSPSRSVAFDILRRVEEDGAYASVLLADETLQLDPRDRSLAYELVLGTLRRQLWLDTVIAHYAGRPLNKIDPPVLRALRLGLYQIRLLSRIPASAAVNESVNLVHRARLRSATGLVNAVLRRALRELDYDPAAGIADPVERLSVESSHPVWLLERWIRSFGLERTRALALANNENPGTVFRFTPRATDHAAIVADLRAAEAELTPSPLVPDAWRIRGAESELRALAQRGLIYVQDEASQWVAHLAGTTYGRSEGKSPLLDICGAPGSKATLMAERAGPNGFVIAGDLYEARIRTIRETSVRTGVSNLGVTAYDAESALPFPDHSLGTVLLDAPCSGTGTLRRNPEIRWRIKPTDISALVEKQRRILAHAAKTVKPGGTLFYSTCSVEVEENEEVVRSFLQNSPDFRGVNLREISPTLAAAPEIGPSAPYQGRFWPQQHGCEGFFVAALTRQLRN
jgi:16S rRNA (cytosine967-C5)-methyltransferase